MLGQACTVPGCTKGAIARGVCPTHYARLRPQAGFTTRAVRVELTCRGVDNPYFKSGAHAPDCKRKWLGTRTFARGLQSYDETGNTFVCHACWLWKLKLDKVQACRTRLLLAGQRRPAPRNRQDVHDIVADARRLGRWGAIHAGRPKGRGRRATGWDWKRMRSTTLVVACRCGVLHLLDTRAGEPAQPLHPGCLGVAQAPAPDVAKTYFDWFVRRTLSDEKLAGSSKDGVQFVRTHLPDPDQVNERYRNLIVTLTAMADANRRRSNTGPVRRSIRPSTRMSNR